MMKSLKILIFLLVLFGACTAHATITRTQLVGNVNTSGTSIAVTTSATVLGSLIIAEINCGCLSSTMAISDNQGNTYTRFVGGWSTANCSSTNCFDLSVGQYNRDGVLWYAVDAFGGVTTVTLTHTVPGPRTWAIVGEYASTNGWPANPTDKTAGPNHTNGAASWTSTATATTSKISELLWGSMEFFADQGAITPGAGWGTGVIQTTSADSLYVNDRIVTTTGTYAFTGTTANSVENGAIIMTFMDNPTPVGSRWVRFLVPGQERGNGRWAITDRERARA